MVVFVRARGLACAVGLVRGFFRYGAGRYVDHVACDAVAGEIFLRGMVALRPLPGRRVRADEDHGNGRGCDNDKGHDEADAPGDMGTKSTGNNERIKDGRHEEVGDAASRITEAGGEGIGGTDNVLVEEASRPDLTGHE